MNKRSGIPDYKTDALLVWVEEEKDRLVQDLGWETNSSAIFTRDTLEYAMQTFGFELESISSCYFYKKCPTLKQMSHARNFRQSKGLTHEKFHTH